MKHPLFLLLFGSGGILIVIISFMGIIQNKKRERSDARLEIVDICLDEVSAIKIKLKNRGDTVAFVKGIRVKVFDSYILKDPITIKYRLIPEGTIYEQVLTNEKIQNFELSESISANDIDGLKLKFCTASILPESRMIFFLNFSLLYDEKKHTEFSEKIIISVISSRDCYGSITLGDILKNNVIANFNALKRFDSYKGKKSDDFLMVRDEYKRTIEGLL